MEAASYNNISVKETSGVNVEQFFTFISYLHINISDMNRYSYSFQITALLLDKGLLDNINKGNLWSS